MFSKIKKMFRLSYELNDDVEFNISEDNEDNGLNGLNGLNDLNEEEDEASKWLEEAEKNNKKPTVKEPNDKNKEESPVQEPNVDVNRIVNQRQNNVIKYIMSKLLNFMTWIQENTEGESVKNGIFSSPAQFINNENLLSKFLKRNESEIGLGSAQFVRDSLRNPDTSNTSAFESAFYKSVDRAVQELNPDGSPKSKIKDGKIMDPGLGNSLLGFLIHAAAQAGTNRGGQGRSLDNQTGDGKRIGDFIGDGQETGTDKIDANRKEKAATEISALERSGIENFASGAVNAHSDVLDFVLDTELSNEKTIRESLPENRDRNSIVADILGSALLSYTDENHPLYLKFVSENPQYFYEYPKRTDKSVIPSEVLNLTPEQRELQAQELSDLGDEFEVRDWILKDSILREFIPEEAESLVDKFLSEDLKEMGRERLSKTQMSVETWASDISNVSAYLSYSLKRKYVDLVKSGMIIDYLRTDPTYSPGKEHPAVQAARIWVAMSTKSQKIKEEFQKAANSASALTMGSEMPSAVWDSMAVRRDENGNFRLVYRSPAEKGKKNKVKFLEDMSEPELLNKAVPFDRWVGDSILNSFAVIPASVERDKFSSRLQIAGLAKDDVKEDDPLVREADAVTDRYVDNIVKNNKSDNPYFFGSETNDHLKGYRNFISNTVLSAINTSGNKPEDIVGSISNKKQRSRVESLLNSMVDGTEWPSYEASDFQAIADALGVRIQEIWIAPKYYDHKLKEDLQSKFPESIRYHVNNVIPDLLDAQRKFKLKYQKSGSPRRNVAPWSGRGKGIDPSGEMSSLTPAEMSEQNDLDMGGPFKPAVMRVMLQALGLHQHHFLKDNNHAYAKAAYELMASDLQEDGEVVSFEQWMKDKTVGKKPMDTSFLIDKRVRFIDNSIKEVKSKIKKENNPQFKEQLTKQLESYEKTKAKLLEELSNSHDPDVYDTFNRNKVHRLMNGEIVPSAPVKQEGKAPSVDFDPKKSPEADLDKEDVESYTPVSDEVKEYVKKNLFRDLTIDQVLKMQSVLVPQVSPYDERLDTVVNLQSNIREQILNMIPAGMNSKNAAEYLVGTLQDSISKKDAKKVETYLKGLLDNGKAQTPSLTVTSYAALSKLLGRSKGDLMIQMGPEKKNIEDSMHPEIFGSMWNRIFYIRSQVIHNAMEMSKGNVNEKMKPWVYHMSLSVLQKTGDVESVRKLQGQYGMKNVEKFMQENLKKVTDAVGRLEAKSNLFELFEVYTPKSLIPKGLVRTSRLLKPISEELYQLSRLCSAGNRFGPNLKKRYEARISGLRKALKIKGL